MLGLLFREPTTVVEAPVVTEVRTGKFWRSFEPVSGSSVSFALMPSGGARLIPSAPFEEIEFWVISFPVPEAIRTPWPPLGNGAPPEPRPKVFPTIVFPLDWRLEFTLKMATP